MNYGAFSFFKSTQFRVENEMCRIMSQSIKLLLAEANAIATLPVEKDPKKWQKITANMSLRNICWKHGQKVLIQLSRKLTKNTC